MKLSRINLVIIHGLIGFILGEFLFLSTYYALSIIVVGTYYILGKPDPLKRYPLIFSSYIVGMEVLLRMTGADLFWEFGKYAVIYFMVLGFIRSNIKIQIYLPILFYFLLLLPSVIIIPMNSFNLWRQDVAFNLSGPAVLTLSSIYFFNRIITKKILSQVLFYMILPIFSMSIYNILMMPDLSIYQFMPYSDFYTSGGYGPNQVSTIFGLGITVLITAHILKIRLTGSKFIDILLLVPFVGLGLITFSRGGVFAAIISFTFAMSHYFFHDQKTTYMLSKSFGLFIIAISIWIAMVSITDGVILQRYGFGNSEYGERVMLDLTGRALIYGIDLNIFYDHIIAGVGPGQANNLRHAYGYKKAAAHTEYSRMLAEHGLLGLFALIILISSFVLNVFKSVSYYSKFIKIFFGVLALLTMGHSAMRLAMPSFLYGFLLCKYKD